MEIFKIENLTFTYPENKSAVLKSINLTVNQGEFITLCGKSGCGKTTLLSLLKPAVAPHGEMSGNITFCGKALSSLDAYEQAAKIGFVMQNPDNQIVTDKVWHELAFGLESLGVSTPEIRTRVAEMASYFGIQGWFHKNVTELSGGQKQMLNLASVMVMQPSVLILDEPTSQLDPISSSEFIKTLEKINRELGTTVLLSEHRLEDAFAVSDRVVVMDKGVIIADAPPVKAGNMVKNHPMYLAMPAPIRIHNAMDSQSPCPLTVREGKNWLEDFAKNNRINPDLIPTQLPETDGETVIDIRDVWFGYEKNSADIVKGLEVSIKKGELFAVLGGNGTGKTTALSLVAGLNKPYRGKISVKGTVGMLPQDPQSVFAQKTVYDELAEMVSQNREEEIAKIASLCCIENLLKSHPYDLSGGEQQRTALAKILLMSPDILLLDEPTKGMDAHFKAEFANILKDLKNIGVTVVMVSHDIEFCAEYADRCAMFFDGNLTSVGYPREFFAGKSFYTTSANRMARSVIPQAVLTDDVILACGGTVAVKTERKMGGNKTKSETKHINKPHKKKPITGILFIVLFLITSILFGTDIFGLKDFVNKGVLQAICALEICFALLCFFPGRNLASGNISESSKLSKRTLFAAILVLLAVPVTIFLGLKLPVPRKYYIISLLIILETFIPFIMVFENRKPKARELVLISVLCAIAVSGRAVFFALPQFKPVIAIIIIAGVCFGGETGFFVGAVTAFVSNFFYGQGPWTTWQMFALGIIGFIAGVLFKKIPKTRLYLCLFGAFATFVLYGGIMNPASVIMVQSKITPEMIISSFLAGLPYDIIHSFSTVFFLWFLAEPLIEKLYRVKIKYGLIK